MPDFDPDQFKTKISNLI